MTPADLPDGERQLAETVIRHLQAMAQHVLSGEPTADPQIRLEWSQAGTQHSGRLLIGAASIEDDSSDDGSSDDGDLADPEPEPELGKSATGATHRLAVPEAITADMARLRAMMARPGTGTWLSATVRLSGERGTLDFNYDQRPYWNATAVSMLHRPEAAPVPDEDRWAADLRRYPRDQDHLLTWLAGQVVAGDEVQRLRAALNGAGFPVGGVSLPGEQHVPFEGTVAVVRHSSAHFSMQIIDYGQHEFLAEYGTEEMACRAVWDYLHQPLPPPTPVSLAELHHRAQAAQPAFDDLYRRITRAGPGGIITNLAAGVPFDRIGTLDGLFFFAWQTPWEQRALPDSARGPGAGQVMLMAPAPVEVHAHLAPAWFGKPGGAIRFRVEGAKHQGLRDLVRTGTLLQVQPGT